MFLSNFLNTKKKTNSTEEEKEEEGKGNMLGDGSMGAVPQRGGVSSAVRSVEGTATTSGSHQHDDKQPFVNHRLAAWEQRRSEWVAAGKAGGGGSGNADGNNSNSSRGHRRPVLSADATYDDLLTSSRPFPQPVPLNEMVDFLVEVWDEDGLYD